MMSSFLCFHHSQHNFTNPLPITICKINQHPFDLKLFDFVYIWKRTNLFSSFHSKVVSPTRHQSLNKPLKHSTPTLYITTTETPQALPEYTKHSPSPSYDYQEIIIDHTSPTPEYHTVKVTTFAPDEKYLHSIKDSQIKPVTEPNQEGSASGERGSISGILTNLQKNNHSPDILTPDIKTLEKILVEINQNEVVAKPPLPVRHNYANYDDDYEDDGRYFWSRCSKYKENQFQITWEMEAPARTRDVLALTIQTTTRFPKRASAAKIKDTKDSSATLAAAAKCGITVISTGEKRAFCVPMEQFSHKLLWHVIGKRLGGVNMSYC